MRATVAKIALLLPLALATLPESASAEVMVAVLEGYNLGILNRKVDEKFTAFSTQGLLGYNFRNFNGHVFFQHMDLAYTFNGDVYEGQYGLAGVGFAYSRPRGKWGKGGKATIIVQKPIMGSYTTLTESSGTVRGQTYKYSELTTLQGGEALQCFVGFELLKTGSGTQKTGENLFLGIFLGYLKQTFATQSTRIKTNNSVLAPGSPGTDPVNYSVTLKSLNFSVNYDL